MVSEFDKKIETSSWVSGKHELFFYGLVRGLRPVLCVELGTYAGFSAYWTALALKHNGQGSLYCYDLWEDYQYNKVDMKVAQKNLLGLPVSLYKGDVFKVHKDYDNGQVDYLNIDVSNDGDKLRYFLNKWYHKLSPHALVTFEGGTEQRDNVDWMKDYGKPKIRKSLGDKLVNSLYRFNVISFFPGITILEKK